MRTGTIWPPILIHAMVNFTALLALGTILVPEQAPLELSLTIFAGVVLAGYGWFLLRDVPHTTGYPGAVS
jgi:membrane protease YdiL (CAAX protease family)